MSSGTNRLLSVGCAAIIAALLIAIAFVACSKVSSSEAGNAEGEATTQLELADDVQAPAETTVKVTFAGDCTLGTDESFSYASSFNAAFEDRGDASWFLSEVAPVFQQDDLTIVNMEGTLTTATARQDKTFAFKGDADFAQVLSAADVEAASLANNHSHDYGDQSYTDTIAAVEGAGVVTFGYERIAYMDVKGVKVALIGAYELAQHEAVADEVSARIHEARDEGAQLVLVYYHWGQEREYVPNETQIFLGHAAIDAGADLVVGSHPHVIQGWEVYEGRYIVYSLGNFCFGGNSGPRDMDCMMFQQTFTVQGSDVAKNDDVEFIACSISSASGYNNYQPIVATGDEKARIDAKIAESTARIAEMGAERQ